VRPAINILGSRVHKVHFKDHSLRVGNLRGFVDPILDDFVSCWRGVANSSN
jgi:hypothetical protein